MLNIPSPLGGIISEEQFVQKSPSGTGLGAQQLNDVDIGTAMVLVISPNAGVTAVTLNGVVSRSVKARKLTVVNNSGAVTLTIAAAAAASLAPNRFITAASITGVGAVVYTWDEVANGWVGIGSTGGSSAPSGSLVAVRLITVSGNVAVTAGATQWKGRIVGGGGGSGGAVGTGASAGASGGGAGGGTTDFLATALPAGPFAFVAGAAGAAGTNGPGNGGAGGDSTLIIGATTYTGKGGGGSVAGANSTVVNANPGGVPGPADVNGVVNLGGQPGSPGLAVVAIGVGQGGDGGSSGLGVGGMGDITGNGIGSLGTGNGAGGGGSQVNGFNANVVGRAGTAGALYLEEYT